MQEQKTHDSNLLAMPDFPLALVTKSSIFVLAFVSVFCLYCFYTSNWIGGTIDLILLFLIVAMIVSRYIKVKKLKKQHDDIAILRQIILTPVFTEQGNSIILNFVKPSNRLIKMMNTLAKEIKNSSHKNERR